GDLVGALTADRELVGDQRRRTRHVGVYTGRRRGVLDDVTNGRHGLVGQRLALTSGKKHLRQCGFAVVALRTRGRERIPPEILDVLDVFGVALQLGDQGVVELVCVGTERLVALDD